MSNEFNTAVIHAKRISALEADMAAIKAKLGLAALAVHPAVAPAAVATTVMAPKDPGLVARLEADLAEALKKI